MNNQEKSPVMNGCLLIKYFLSSLCCCLTRSINYSTTLNFSSGVNTPAATTSTWTKTVDNSSPAPVVTIIIIDSCEEWRGDDCWNCSSHDEDEECANVGWVDVEEGRVYQLNSLQIVGSSEHVEHVEHVVQGLQDNYHLHPSNLAH